jgi:hypothetical protein
MKSIRNKKNIWNKTNNVVLRVDNIGLIYGKNIRILLDCGFENISRGRCKLKLKKKTKDTIDDLFIHSDKALMEVNVHYNLSDLNEILKYLSYKKNSSKKIKIQVKISDSIMTNDLGDLYISDKTKIKIESIEWDIPIM